MERKLYKSDVIKRCHSLARFNERYCGVYFLLNLGEVVYVGKSTCMPSRIQNHLSEGRKKFDSWYMHPVPIDLIDEEERMYIKSMKPMYNSSMNDEFDRVSAYPDCDWSDSDIERLAPNARFNILVKQIEKDSYPMKNPSKDTYLKKGDRMYMRIGDEYFMTDRVDSFRLYGRICYTKNIIGPIKPVD